MVVSTTYKPLYLILDSDPEALESDCMLKDTNGWWQTPKTNKRGDVLHCCSRSGHGHGLNANLLNFLKDRFVEARR